MRWLVGGGGTVNPSGAAIPGVIKTGVLCSPNYSCAAPRGDFGIARKERQIGLEASYKF